MRAIERTTQFRRDFKRELKSRHRATLQADLVTLLGVLVSDRPLAEKYRDHPLSGDWSGFRDCHLKPDSVLIYEKPDAQTLRLVRLGVGPNTGLKVEDLSAGEITGEAGKGHRGAVT
jgi:mRNA interferase YafQ